MGGTVRTVVDGTPEVGVALSIGDGGTEEVAAAVRMVVDGTVEVGLALGIGNGGTEKVGGRSPNGGVW